MNGKEAFKLYRTEKGYSIRQFAAMLQVSPKTVYSYESKEVPIASMPVGRAVAAFSMLDADLEAFFDFFYPYKEELSAEIALWKKNNPVVTDYNVLKTRLNTRIIKAKERNILSEKSYKKVYNQFVKTFAKLDKQKNESGNISETDYAEYIVPIYQLIRKETYQIKNEYLKEGFSRSPYKLSEVAEFCGINSTYFASVVNGKREIATLHVITVLKLCYVLELDFKKLVCGSDVVESRHGK